MIIEIIMAFIVSIIAAMIIHEGMHAITCRLLSGKWIKFYFSLAYKIVPRGIWYMPNIDQNKQKLIAQLGFGAEIILMPVVLSLHPLYGVIYSIVVICHFLAYPWYSGGASDFKWFLNYDNSIKRYLYFKFLETKRLKKEERLKEA